MSEPDEQIRAAIEEAVKAGDAAGLPHRRNVGEMLLEARTQFNDPGEWIGWVERNFKLTAKAAYGYMELAGHPKEEVEALALVAKYARARAREEAKSREAET